jgi:hypothetical protein
MMKKIETEKPMRSFEDGLGISTTMRSKIRYHFSSVHYKTLLCSCRLVIDEELCPYGPYHSPKDTVNPTTCVFVHSQQDLRPPPPTEFSLSSFEVHKLT